jgi:transposase
LQRWGGKLAKVGLESGSMTPWLARELAKAGFPVVCMDARAAADAVKSRRVKSDKADAYALAEMLRTGWYGAVYVKSEDSHRLKAMLGARDQLVRAKRALGNQVRGTTAAVWHSTAVAAGDQEVRRGGASGGVAR